MADHLYPELERFLGRPDKESLLNQKGMVCWLYGLSGSGKSTIANAVERQLFEEGRMTVLLDGDNIRGGLNRNLGFSDEDRLENIRRTAELAKLLALNGLIVLVALITPRNDYRSLARKIIGEDYVEVYVKADYATCMERDPKGLYEKVKAGQVKNFTGKDSQFEEPDQADLVIDTETRDVHSSASYLLEALKRMKSHKDD